MQKAKTEPNILTEEGDTEYHDGLEKIVFIVSIISWLNNFDHYHQLVNN